MHANNNNNCGPQVLSLLEARAADQSSSEAGGGAGTDLRLDLSAGGPGAAADAAFVTGGGGGGGGVLWANDVEREAGYAQRFPPSLSDLLQVCVRVQCVTAASFILAALAAPLAPCSLFAPRSPLPTLHTFPSMHLSYDRSLLRLCPALLFLML